MAHSGFSPENTTTLVEGLPLAAEWKRSTAAASPPPTRMVFRVALEGKPSLAAASLSLDLAPICGGPLPESPPTLHPASPPTQASAASGAVLLLQRATGGGR